METEFKRYNKYIVVKKEDIKYLYTYYQYLLNQILEMIEFGRSTDCKKPNYYVVVNEDQPYAEQVWALIKEQWEKDNKQECPHLHKWHNPGYADSQMKCLDCGEENV